MSSTDAILDRLRHDRQRLTLQRRLIIEVLCERGDHLTVNDVQQHLHSKGCDLNEPTVYRNLQWLKDQGIVSQTDLGGSGIVYQIVGARPHHHLVCLHCGGVVDLEDQLLDDLREQLRRRYGFEPRIDHMAIFGICQTCQDQETARAGQP
jgi:Fur family ferric uptake transcriptional regulator